MAALPREELYSNYAEPDPDYLDDETDGANQDENGDFPPPPPPLTDEELSAAVADAYDSHVRNGTSPTADGSTPTTSEEPPQIKPKPLYNPCLESKERQNLHKELLMNYKIGKDVLQKPELNKVLRERRETARKKEWEEQKSSKGRTSLELRLDQIRKKEDEDEQSKMKAIKEDEQAPELTRIHRKITTKAGTSDSADKS